MTARKTPLTILFTIIAVSQFYTAKATDWPGLITPEAFQEEIWAEGRVLVYAKPGEDGDAKNASSWLAYASMADYEAGNKGTILDRRTKDFFNHNTDVIIPDAPDGKPYVVGYSAVGKKGRKSGQISGFSTYGVPTFVCRHLAIGKGASLDCGYGKPRRTFSYSASFTGDAPAEIYGNVNIETGGSAYAHFYFVGDKHSVIKIGDSAELQGHAFRVKKTGSASVTYLAKRYDLVMGLQIESGRFVMGPGSHLGINATYEMRQKAKKITKTTGYDTTTSNVFVEEGAALELRSGSYISQVKPLDAFIPNVHLKGTLQVGHKQESNKKAATIELNLIEGSGNYLGQPGGLYVRPTAVINNHGSLAITADNKTGARGKEKGVSVFLENNANFGKVSLDYLRSGGIAARSPVASKALLTKATIGPHCAGKGDVLTAVIAGVNFKGGMGTVEFVDGLKTECEILYPHPNAPRLVVRSKGYRTVQTFDLKTICATTIAGKRTDFNPKRALSDSEQKSRASSPLWADIPGKGQIGKYGTQQWPKLPLQVWAYPGKSGPIHVGSNWLDDKGNPCFESTLRPYGVALDVLLPEADEAYEIFSIAGKDKNVILRHYTGEANSSWNMPYNVQGNFWLKKDSDFDGNHYGKFENEMPNLHRFHHFDGIHASTGHWNSFTNGEGGTQEIIGISGGASDRLHVRSGTLIVSENSALGNGSRAAFGIYPGATVILLQNARLGHNQRVGAASVSIGGTLMVGHPDKPITKDMLFPLVGVVKDNWKHVSSFDVRSTGTSFTMLEDARFVMHNANPETAKLIFRSHEGENRSGQAGYKGMTSFGVALTFAGETVLNGVLFDDVVPGGIAARPEMRAQWKHVTYGKNNLSSLSGLHVDFK